MTKKKKKILIISISVSALLIVATVVTLLLIHFLKKDDEDEKKNRVALNVKSCELLIGDEFILSMDYDLDGDTSFTYSSSDENIAKVDENGKVVAVNSGTATITVTYGDASDTCEITVGRGNVLAYLEYEQIPNGVIRLCVNDELPLAPIVSFNGKTYRDVAVEYTLSNSAVGVVQDGTFIAKSLGTTEIYATATWRGVGGESLTKIFTVEVVNDVQIFLNQGADNSLLLRTLDNQRVPVIAGATENGRAIEDVSLSLADGGEKYLDFDGDSIRSKGLAGETVLVASCTDSLGQTYEKAFNVTVTQTVLPYTGGTITGFSAIDGDFVGDTSLLKVLGGKVVKAEDANGNPLEVRAGKIYGVETSKTGLTKTTITAYSSRVGYVLDIEGYTGIIDEAEDLQWFGVKNNGYKTHPIYIEEEKELNKDTPEGADRKSPGDRGYTYLAQRQDGYYILANDIDASDYVQPAGGDGLTSSISSITKLVEPLGGIGLTGTFDGMGHTIRGITMQAHGLFGIIFGGTLKNVAFTQVKTAKTYGSPIAQWIINGIMENVYVQADSITGNASGLIAGCLSGTLLRGCLFEYAQETSTQASYGSLSYMGGSVSSKSGFKLNTFNGVYVVSPMVLTNYKASDAEGHYTVDGENRTGSTYLFSGVKRYDTQADFENANETFVPFDFEYWDKTGATPVWKTKDFIPVPKEEDSKIDLGTSMGDFNAGWLS